jgi:hypothetical protein
MKSLILPLVVLSIALFAGLDAAPVLPSGFEAELDAVARQQSDDSEMAKTFLNIFTKILTSKINGGDGSIQADNEIGRTLLNVASGLLSAAGKKADPNDKLQQSLLNGFSSVLSAIGSRLGEGGEIQSDNDEMMKTVMNVLGTFLSAMTKTNDNGEIQSWDEFMPTALNLFSNVLSHARKNVDPEDDTAKSFLDGFNTVLSAFGRKLSNGGGGTQIQSDDNGLSGVFLNLLGNLGSSLQRKADPKDDVAQTIFSLFNTVLSGAKNKIGGGGSQEVVRADTLPTYMAERFVDQSILESINENAAVMEGDVDVSEEAKTQLWGAILRTVASSLLSKYLKG